VLRSRESPSGARIVTLLSAEAGIVDAFVFGGPKSRLRSLASPWHAGRAWIYRDGTEFIKLTDFDAVRERPAIRGSLGAIGAASLATELTIASDALGGDRADAAALFEDLLEALDATLGEAQAPGAAMDSILVQYCLRALSLMGVMPDPSECGACGGAIAMDAARSYSRRRGAFLCAYCSDEDGAMGLPAGAVRWMRSTQGMPFGKAVRVGLARESLAALKACAFDLLAKAAHAPLRTIETGMV